MNNPGGVGPVERVGNLQAYVQRFIESQRLLINQLTKGLPVYELSRDEVGRESDSPIS